MNRHLLSNFGISIVMLGCYFLFTLYQSGHVYAQTSVNFTKLFQDKYTKALVNPEVDKTFGTPPTVPYQHAVVKYESPTTILISGDLIIGYTGTFNSVLWEAMDLLKNQYGFKIQQVMTSGVGSVGNPTIVYILMTK